ncbi:hypothetical protein ACZ87_03421, partial [Candidatus Erwinia dacicola]
RPERCLMAPYTKFDNNPKKFVPDVERLFQPSPFFL